MNVGLHQRVDEIDWQAYSTAYGRADKVPDQLKRLASDDFATAMSASHDLWCGLCHQHAYVSSAALPAYPFLLEVLDSANEQLTVEILDILAGFAKCSALGLGDVPSPHQWVQHLRDKLLEQLPLFKELTQHTNEEIAGFAERIVEDITTDVA